MIPRYFVVAESGHELQNPTSKEKILELGERIGLGPKSRILDIASGRGGPALVLAGAYGCMIQGVEFSPDFLAVANERIESAGLADRVSFRLGDASQETFDAQSFDAALCLGASFVWGDLARTLDALEPAVRSRGHVVVGEPYWRKLPVPDDYEFRTLPCTTLEGTVDIFESGDLVVTDVLASTEDEWDRYETQHWAAVDEWLAENADDSDAADIRTRHESYKRSYLRHGRDYLGWAIFVGRKKS